MKVIAACARQLCARALKSLKKSCGLAEWRCSRSPPPVGAPRLSSTGYKAIRTTPRQPPTAARFAARHTGRASSHAGPGQGRGRCFAAPPKRHVADEAKQNGPRQVGRAGQDKSCRRELVEFIHRPHRKPDALTAGASGKFVCWRVSGSNLPATSPVKVKNRMPQTELFPKKQAA